MTEGTGGAITTTTEPSVVSIVEKRVRQLTGDGELRLPESYSADNALKSAWLKLQTVTDKQKRPALEVCTRASISNALLDMVVQGFNPAKDQCYFVVYGKVLVCMRSYHGAQALLQRVWPGSEIWAEPVYNGDVFEYSIERGQKTITTHTQKLENIQGGKIVAAYCTIDRKDHPSHTEIMTFDQIKEAWRMGSAYKENGSGPHQKFDDRMTRKVVISRACMLLVRTSDDRYLAQAVDRQAELVSEVQTEEEMATEANAEIIDVDSTVESETPDPVEPTSPVVLFQLLCEEHNMPLEEAKRLAAKISGKETFLMRAEDYATILETPDAFVNGFLDQRIAEGQKEQDLGPGF